MSTLRTLAPLAEPQSGWHSPPGTVPLGTPDDLLRLRDTAARVVGARHSGDDAEDLVQEAWVRVTVALRDRPIDDPHAYTAGVAANLVRGWARKDKRHQRWAPLLWVRPTVDAADNEIVQNEEASALACALAQLPEPARDVLVAHVVHGMDTATLALEADSTPAAVAACLARARAMLRVEYLIAFRHLPELPEHCRRVCYAVSAKDTRRETRLDAGAHVRQCLACASLTADLHERRRPAMIAPFLVRISGWLNRAAGIDWQQTAPRVAMAGGLVSVGVVSALALGTVMRPARPLTPAPRVSAAGLLAAPAPAALPRLSLDRHHAGALHTVDGPAVGHLPKKVSQAKSSTRTLGFESVTITAPVQAPAGTPTAVAGTQTSLTGQIATVAVDHGVVIEFDPALLGRAF